jgi:hypothetical protein
MRVRGQTRKASATGFRKSSDVCLWHLADMPIGLTDVRFRGQSGHRLDLAKCPLMNQADISWNTTGIKS